MNNVSKFPNVALQQALSQPVVDFLDLCNTYGVDSVAEAMGGNTEAVMEELEELVRMHQELDRSHTDQNITIHIHNAAPPVTSQLSFWAGLFLSTSLLWVAYLALA